MEDCTTVKPFDGQPATKRNFMVMHEKKEHFRTKDYLEVLSHYNAQLLVQVEGPIMIIRRNTGTQLPLEHTAKLHMVRLLLDEFGTVDGANKAVEDYKTSRS